jgi:hypothetical protein
MSWTLHTLHLHTNVIKFNSSSLFISERLATRANNRTSTICYDRNYLKEGFKKIFSDACWLWVTETVLSRELCSCKLCVSPVSQLPLSRDNPPTEHSNRYYGILLLLAWPAFPGILRPHSPEGSLGSSTDIPFFLAHTHTHTHACIHKHTHAHTLAICCTAFSLPIFFP